MLGEAARSYEVPAHVVAATLISRLDEMGCQLLGVGDFGNSVTFRCAVPDGSKAATMTARMDGRDGGSVMTLEPEDVDPASREGLETIQDRILAEVTERLRTLGVVETDSRPASDQALSPS